MAQAGPLSPEAVHQLCDALSARLRPDQYSTAYTDRIAYARDQWPRSLLKLRQGTLETPPDIIIWPESAEEAADVLALTQGQQAPINAIAAGGGSSVTGASSPMRSGVIIDLKRLRKVRWIDLDKGLAEIEAGTLGMHLEEALNRAGATLGHFPSSIMCSTLGGWAAARSAGQASSRYGKIEDMIQDVELATVSRQDEDVTGQLSWCRGVFDPTPLVVGSEGRLGLITACRVRIHPAPVARSFRGVLFPSIEAGLTAMREMMQSGDVPPTILRLYDPVDTAISSHRRVKDDPEHPIARQLDGVKLPTNSRALVKAETQSQTPMARLRKSVGSRLKSVALPVVQQALHRANTSMGLINAVMPHNCLLILGCEGHTEAAADALLQRHLQRCLRADGDDLGEAPGWHWFDGRYNVSFKLSTVFANGAFADTMEVAARWPQVLPLYHKVRDAIGQDAVVMAHFSHAYPDGCSIYFSFAAQAPEDDELPRYDRIWQRGLAATAALGAGVSHHHGIGFAKAHAMQQEWGPAGMSLMRAVREAYDPNNQLNPGKLGLDASPQGSQPERPRARLTLDERLTALQAATPHLPWSHQTLMSDLDAWAHYGSPANPNQHRLALQSWHDLQVLLRQNQSFHVPLFTSDGPSPGDGLWIDLPLPTDSPPSFQLDEEAMLLTCDSRFTLEAIESYARMSGFTTGLRGDAMTTLRQWFDRGHQYEVNVQRTLSNTQIFSLTALLSSGEEVHLGRAPRASSGPDIKQLFWQTGGTFGIVKRATLRLRRVKSDLQVWRTSHVELSEAVTQLHELFLHQQPPQALALWHALPKGPSRLTVQFCPQESPAIVERYQRIAKVQEMSALPSPPLPSTPWWLAVSGHWSALPKLAGLIQQETPWPLLRLHLAQASHEGGIWLVSFSPAVPPKTKPSGFDEFVLKISQHPEVTGVWGDTRFVHAASLDPKNAAILRRIKRSIDPHNALNPHALADHLNAASPETPEDNDTPSSRPEEARS